MGYTAGVVKIMASVMGGSTVLKSCFFRRDDNEDLLLSFLGSVFRDKKEDFSSRHCQFYGIVLSR
jgi:hypothetical protein